MKYYDVSFIGDGYGQANIIIGDDETTIERVQEFFSLRFPQKEFVGCREINEVEYQSNLKRGKPVIDINLPTTRFYARIRFDKPLPLQDEVLYWYDSHPIEINEKFMLGYEETAVSVVSEDRTEIEVMFKNPDLDSFEDWKRLLVKDLERVTSIDNEFIVLDSDDKEYEQLPKPVSMEAAFVFPYGEHEQIDIKPEICNSLYMTKEKEK